MDLNPSQAKEKMMKFLIAALERMKEINGYITNGNSCEIFEQYDAISVADASVGFIN